MSQSRYWVNLFNLETWEEAVLSGLKFAGFNESRWTTVKKIRPGDYLLCYITGISRFVALMEVVDKPFKDEKAPQIWKSRLYPCRVPVKVRIQLEPKTAIPIHELKERLEICQNLKVPQAWGVYFRSSPTKFPLREAETIIAALKEAKERPKPRDFDKKKLQRPPIIETTGGGVVIPDTGDTDEPEQPTATATTHTEIQWLLLKLGSDMGHQVWVARNDRGKDWNGNKIVDIPRLLDKLPLQFDEATTRTIELIDVLWLSKNSIAAAFEVESTTSIYSGLLRMGDLVSMQPNINMPLFIVAPYERREKVFAEINRPTFSRLSPPLREICRYISFPSLKKFLDKHSTVLNFLKADIICSDEVSESCEPDFAG